MSREIVTTEAESEFFARFPEDGDVSPTDEQARGFAEAWLQDACEGKHYKLEANYFDGYADGREAGRGVVSANWNYVERRTQSLLEQAGYVLDWCDQVSGCSGCYKAIETEPTHYGWTPQYHAGDGEILCANCLSDDPEPMLRDLRGDPERALTLDSIDLADHGYVRVERTFENGFYGGQDDSPRAIAKWLRERGVADFIFEVDSVGQFDMRFSVWVREEDAEKAEGANGKATVDPARAMEAALRSIPVGSTGGGVQYMKVSIGDEGATVATRTLTAEEFIDGIKN